MNITSEALCSGYIHNLFLFYCAWSKSANILPLFRMLIFQSGAISASRRLLSIRARFGSPVAPCVRLSFSTPLFLPAFCSVRELVQLSFEHRLLREVAAESICGILIYPGYADSSFSTADSDESSSASTTIPIEFEESWSEDGANDMLCFFTAVALPLDLGSS